MPSRTLFSSVEVCLSGASKLGIVVMDCATLQVSVLECSSVGLLAAFRVCCAPAVFGTFSSLGLWLCSPDIFAGIGNWNWNPDLPFFSINSGCSGYLFWWSALWVPWTISGVVGLMSCVWSPRSISAASMFSFLWTGMLSKARTIALQSRASKDD